VGYSTREIAVNGRTTITTSLKMLSQQLADFSVQVSTGYQTLPKERATGSFAFVDNQLLNRRVSTDVLSKLEGVVPGLLVNRNVNTVNNPNGIDISIRGYSTLFANAQPLIVVDNFPYDGNIANINPNDIESVSVLKDAAASSIWGVQSGNGVIVITTKKGHRNQKMGIEVNANVTVGAKPDLFYSPDFLDSKDFIGVEQSLFNQGYYDARLTDPTHPPVSPVVQLLADQRSGLLSTGEVTGQINALQNMDVRNDLKKYFYQHSVNQQYAVNLRGGGNTNDYVFSVGYDNNLANLVGNSNDRFTLKALNNFYPVKNLEVSAEVNYTQSSIHSNSPVSGITTGGGYATVYPYAQLADPHGNALSIVKDYNQSWVSDPAAQAGLLNWQYKPLDELKYADNSSKLIDNRLVAGIKYSFLQGFSAEVKYQYEKTNAWANNNYSDSTYYARDLINQYTNLTASNKYPIPVGGILQQNNSAVSSNRLRGQLNYSHRWKQQHELTAIAGAEVNQAVTERNIPATTYGYNATNGSYQNVDLVDRFIISPSQTLALIPNSQGFGKLTDRYVSYYGNAAYTFLSRYTLSASGRIDKSNLFGVNTNQKSVPLWSVGGKWAIDKEVFYTINKWLPVLQLRATYGYNGNLNKSATAVTTIQQLSNSYYFGLPYAQIASPGNPELRWEKDRMVNFGLDFGLKDNLLSGSIEYYLKEGIDLFGNSPLAPSTGLSSFFGNTADTKGHGWELTLNLQTITTRNFHWTTNFLLSYAQDKVTRYDVPFDAANYLSANADANSGYSLTPTVGKPIFSIYSYRSAGLTHTTGDPQGYLNGKISTDYASIIGTATFDSLHFNGSARPTTFGSFRNTLSYKSFSLSFNILYKLNYFFHRTSITYASLYQTWVGHKDFSKRWQQPGDETKTKVPSMPSLANLNGNRDNFYRNSDALVDKGDHIRLQDITLSYDLDNPVWAGRAFSHISVYCYINNVGILWKANHDGLDPDLFASGLPLPRTIALGIKTNF
jgi:TonB-linked SusC/RagA family outer membrane protein